MKDSYQVFKKWWWNKLLKTSFLQVISFQCNVTFSPSTMKRKYTCSNSHIKNSHCRNHYENWDPRRWAVTQREQQRKGFGVMNALCHNVNRWLFALSPHLLVWAKVDKAIYLHKLLPVIWQTAGAQRNQLYLSACPHPGRAKREGD